MHIKDAIAHCGVGAKVAGWDVPHCFEWNTILERIRKLFVYRTITAAHGEEFWIGAVNPLGWTPAEWRWQCILAVLLWYFLKAY